MPVTSTIRRRRGVAGAGPGVTGSSDGLGRHGVPWGPAPAVPRAQLAGFAQSWSAVHPSRWRHAGAGRTMLPGAGGPRTCPVVRVAATTGGENGRRQRCAVHERAPPATATPPRRHARQYFDHDAGRGGNEQIGRHGRKSGPEGLVRRAPKIILRSRSIILRARLLPRRQVSLAEPVGIGESVAAMNG